MMNKKKAYLVKSQGAYDKLMKELEEKGYLWRTGEKPTEADSSLAYTPYYPSEMYIYLDDKEISCSGDKFFTEYYFKDYELIEYPEPEDTISKMIKMGEHSIARSLADNFREWKLERSKVKEREDELY